jgi:hypothetical protein
MTTTVRVAKGSEHHGAMTAYRRLDRSHQPKTQTTGKKSTPDPVPIQPNPHTESIRRQVIRSDRRDQYQDALQNVINTYNVLANHRNGDERGAKGSKVDQQWHLASLQPIFEDAKRNSVSVGVHNVRCEQDSHQRICPTEPFEHCCPASRTPTQGHGLEVAIREHKTKARSVAWVLQCTIVRKSTMKAAKMRP